MYPLAIMIQEGTLVFQCYGIAVNFYILIAHCGVFEYPCGGNFGIISGEIPQFPVYLW